MSSEREGVEPQLPVRVAAAALSAAAGLISPEAAIVGAGAAPLLEVVLNQIWVPLTTRRIERVAETLTDAAGELGGDATEQLARIADMAASDEAFQELLTRALNIAGDTSMRDKRRALSRALANALNDVGTKVDNEIAFTRMLDDLDPVHIRVLRIMSRRPKHLDYLADRMDPPDDLQALRQWYAWSIVAADPGLEEAVHGALRMLERHGLVWDRGPQLVPQPHGMQNEYMISPYGDYLIERLAGPEEEANPLSA